MRVIDPTQRQCGLHRDEAPRRLRCLRDPHRACCGDRMSDIRPAMRCKRPVQGVAWNRTTNGGRLRLTAPSMMTMSRFDPWRGGLSHAIAN
jgi:hypothetical protein